MNMNEPSTHETSSCHKTSYKVCQDHVKDNTTVILQKDVIDQLDHQPGDKLSIELNDHSECVISNVKYTQVDVDFEPDDLTWYMQEAHARDITLNQLINDVIHEYLRDDKHN